MSTLQPESSFHFATVTRLVLAWMVVACGAISCREPDDAPRSTFGGGREGPVTGLCNQLVVMSVRGFALLPSPGLSPFDRRDRLFCFVATPGAPFRIELSTTA